MNVEIKTDVDSEEQRTSYQNGTLQSIPGGMAITVQTHLQVPAAIGESGQGAAETWIRHKLATISELHPEIRFSVQIGIDLDNLSN